jgi:choline transport protein
MLNQRRSFTAEETRGAATTLPRSIMWSTVLNSSLGLAIVLTVCYIWGDMDELRETPTGYPFIQIFYNATQSLAGTSIMAIIVLLTLLGSTIAVTATASRQIWSFSRDEGVPFSSVISRVSWESHGLTVQTSLISTGQSGLECPC